MLFRSQKGFDVVRILFVGDPVIAEDNKHMNAVGTVLDRQFQAGQKKESSFLAAFAKVLNSSRSNLLWFVMTATRIPAALRAAT